jgi:hypothetical protein
VTLSNTTRHEHLDNICNIAYYADLKKGVTVSMTVKQLTGQDRKPTIFLCVHVLTLPIEQYYNITG